MRDALTFAPRELHGTERNSELSQAVNESVWQSATDSSAVAEGVNRITLFGLEPDTEYFYRVLVDNDVSRIWNGETHSFATTKSGSAPITPEVWPPRTRTYTVSGNQRTLEGRLVRIDGENVIIERSSDGKTGTLRLEMLSESDRDHLSQPGPTQ